MPSETDPLPPLVVFDLDDTLIRGDSFARFCGERLLQHWWRLALAALVCPVLFVLFSQRRTRLPALSALVWIATARLSQTDLERLMDDFVARHFAKSPALHCASAIAALREHQHAGAKVVIATGCTAALAERICGALDLRDVTVVGSTLRPWRGGWVADKHCFGRKKVATLIAAGLGDTWDVAYTDSAADIPLLSRARRRVLVNPKPATQARISAALGATFDVMTG